MGRLSDAMGAIFLGYSTLHHFSRNHQAVAGLNALAESSLLQLECEAQAALRDAAANFPAPLGAFGGLLMSAGVAPLGEIMRPYRPPRDNVVKEVAKLLSTPSAVSAMFAEGIYTEGDTRVAALLKALPVAVEADAVAAELKKTKRVPTAEEEALLQRAVALRDEPCRLMCTRRWDISRRKAATSGPRSPQRLAASTACPPTSATRSPPLPRQLDRRVWACVRPTLPSIVLARRA